MKANEGLAPRLELLGMPDDPDIMLRIKDMDAAAIGVAGRCGMDEVLVYDRDKLLDLLCKQNGWTGEEAAEWSSYNIEDAWLGDRTPLIFRKFPETDWVVKAARTAIHRSRLPKPVSVLVDDPRIRGHVLDFGCGRDRQTGGFLLDLPGVKTVTMYDPSQVVPKASLNLKMVASYDDVKYHYYNAVMCTYVMNTLPMEARRLAYLELFAALAPRGTAFITVRGDRQIDGAPYEDGVITSVGTFQKRYTLANFLGELSLFMPKRSDMESTASTANYHTAAITLRH